VISWTALALLTVGSVGYLGSAPALSVFGLASVFLYVLPGFVFLVPVSLVAAELASGWPGGVYNWVREGISAPMGLLAVWCQFAQTILFPLAIVSNGLVPTQHMPAVLRFIADWNPVSAVTAAARQLWGNPNPSATIQAWPMQHPVEASLLWSVALLLIFAPLATVLYRRRTTG
jgi:hypothetical protein